MKLNRTLVKYLKDVIIKYLDKIEISNFSEEINQKKNNTIKQKNSDILFDNINRNLAN